MGGPQAPNTTKEDFLTNNTAHRFVQRPDEIPRVDYAEKNERLLLFLDKLAREYQLVGNTNQA